VRIFSFLTSNSILENIIAELVVTIGGVLIANTIWRWWNNWHFGRWKLTVIKDGQTKIENKPISAGKMKQFKELPEELPIYLKGVCSPYHRIQCDIIADGSKTGLFKMDPKNREIKTIPI